MSKDCEFGTPADFGREAVEDWLAARIGEDMSARSRSYYRESLVAFANWCAETGRLMGHDLDRVPKADQKADPRRQRRALTEDELRRVLVVAAARPLTDTQTVLRGKRKGEAVAELKPETVTRLQAVGIPKRDDRGRTVDVHAMRTTFGTLLSTTGTAPRTAQPAMRHSDIKLTVGVYTDPRLLDVRGAMEKLPSLPLPRRRPTSNSPPPRANPHPGTLRPASPRPPSGAAGRRSSRTRSTP